MSFPPNECEETRLWLKNKTDEKQLVTNEQIRRFNILGLLIRCTDIRVIQRFRVVYLTIIPRARVGYEMVDSQRGHSAELAITISYPTSASEIIIILLKTPKELQYLSSPTVLADAYTYHICGQWYMGSYTMACKPIKTQELQYTIDSF